MATSSSLLLPRSRRSSPSPAGQASGISSIINLLNTIIGAGVLAMPLAMSHMGICLGTIIILWSGITAGFGLYLQTRCARYLERGNASFFALSQITYPNAAVLFDAAIAVKCFGVGVSYLIIIGDLMPGVIRGMIGDRFETSSLWGDRFFWITVFMLIVIPLSFLRRLDSLKYTSVIALVSISYLVVLVLWHFLERDTIPDRGEVRVIEWKGAIPALSSLPVVVFAFTCHQNMFSILNEIKDGSSKSTTRVVIASVGTSASVYVLVAITGYLSFGDNVVGNIVSQYLPSISSTIGKAAIVVLVIFSFPLQAHPCRASINAVLNWRPGNSLNKRSNSPARLHKAVEISETRFAMITVGIIISSYIVAMTVSSLDRVLAYVGSTGSTTISFILPGLFYYKISNPNSDIHQRLSRRDDDREEDDSEGEEQDLRVRSNDNSKWPWSPLQSINVTRKLSLCLVVYGVCVMITCLVTNVINTVKH